MILNVFFPWKAHTKSNISIHQHSSRNSTVLVYTNLLFLQLYCSTEQFHQQIHRIGPSSIPFLSFKPGWACRADKNERPPNTCLKETFNMCPYPSKWWCWRLSLPKFLGHSLDLIFFQTSGIQFSDASWPLADDVIPCNRHNSCHIAKEVWCNINQKHSETSSK